MFSDSLPWFFISSYTLRVWIIIQFNYKLAFITTSELEWLASHWHQQRRLRWLCVWSLLLHLNVYQQKAISWYFTWFPHLSIGFATSPIPQLSSFYPRNIHNIESSRHYPQIPYWGRLSSYRENPSWAEDWHCALRFTLQVLRAHLKRRYVEIYGVDTRFIRQEFWMEKTRFSQLKQFQELCLKYVFNLSEPNFAKAWQRACARTYPKVGTAPRLARPCSRVTTPSFGSQWEWGWATAIYRNIFLYFTDIDR